MPSVQQQGSSEDLSQFCSYERRQLFRHIMPIVRTLGADTHLDQLVGFERRVDGGDDSIRQSEFAQLNERIEVMTERSQVALLFTGERHGLSIGTSSEVDR